MVFFPPHKSEYFIKRVIGIPGDRVRFQDNILHINGEKQSQNFVVQIPPMSPKFLRYREKLGHVEHMIQRNSYRDTRTEEWVVPEGHYFMMGDNRDQSSDSRILSQLGFIPFENLVGKAQIIFYSRDREESLWKLWLWPSSIRVERLFKSI